MSYKQLVEIVGNLVSPVYFKDRDGLNVHQNEKDQGQTNLDECHREVNVFFTLVLVVFDSWFNYSDKVVEL